VVAAVLVAAVPLTWHLASPIRRLPGPARHHLWPLLWARHRELASGALAAAASRLVMAVRGQHQ
jgi:hypothetical protein